MADGEPTRVRPAWVDDALFPFESRFMEVDGHVIHYVDEGSGPVLLMLHGNPTWSFVYHGVIARLREQFRCVAVDYPGFGLSVAGPGYRYLPEEHAAVVLAVLDRLGLSGVTLVVQDWGGPIGMWVAEHRPAAFRALVVGNTWAWPVNGDWHFEWFSHAMGGAAGQRLPGPRPGRGRGRRRPDRSLPRGNGTGGSHGAAAPGKPSSRSAAPSWSSSGTCYLTPAPTTPIWAPASSASGSTPNGANAPTSTISKRSATKSPSNPPPDQHLHPSPAPLRSAGRCRLPGNSPIFGLARPPCGLRQGAMARRAGGAGVGTGRRTSGRAGL
jgi:alpha/beta hydrolase fold